MTVRVQPGAIEGAVLRRLHPVGEGPLRRGPPMLHPRDGRAIGRSRALDPLLHPAQVHDLAHARIVPRPAGASE